MSTNPVLFSVVLPCYNRADFIKATILSVQQQHYKNWELIIVNDGSTDNTESIVQSINDSRIQYIAIPNSERGAARNTGIKRAKGDYVCFLDSDDKLLPHHLSQAATFIVTHPEAMVFHQGYEIQSENKKVLYSSKQLPTVLNKLLVTNNVISPNGIFIKQHIITKNLFNPERKLAGTEDYELWLRIASQYTILHHEPCTSVLLDHQQRSMKENDLQKLLNRIQFFLDCVSKNTDVKNYMGANYSKFKAWRFSYIALHAALSIQHKTALQYIGKTVAVYPLFIFTKRFYIVFYRILISG